MQLTSLNYGLWILTVVLNAALVALIFHRGIARRLPFFAAYATLNLLQSPYDWAIITYLGYQEPHAYQYATIGQAVVFTARAAAIVELCYHLLRPYKGVWALSWRLLVVSSAIIVTYAAVEAVRQRFWIFTFVTSLERGMELAAAVTLILLFGFMAYYRIRAPRPETTIAVGLAFVSIFKVTFESFLRQRLDQFVLLRLTNQLYFQIVLLLWIVAVGNPAEAVVPAPALLDRETYGELVPQFNYRLQRVNERLADFLGSQTK